MSDLQETPVVSAERFLHRPLAAIALMTRLHLFVAGSPW
jgi:hypothetical protein